MSGQAPKLNVEGVTIYSKPACKFCVLAKEFFDRHKITYREVYLDPKTDEYNEAVDVLLEKTPQRSFPFIFIGAEFLGGYQELETAYSTLRLHEMLAKIGITMLMDF